MAIYGVHLTGKFVFPNPCKSEIYARHLVIDMRYMKHLHTEFLLTVNITNRFKSCLSRFFTPIPSACQMKMVDQIRLRCVAIGTDIMRNRVNEGLPCLPSSSSAKMTTNGGDPDKIMDGHNSHYTYSPTTISFAPSESVTLSVYNNPSSQEKSRAIDVPNITVPAEHKNRTLILCFDGTGDQ